MNSTDVPTADATDAAMDGAGDGGDAAPPDATSAEDVVDDVPSVVETPITVASTRGALIGRTRGAVSAFLGVPYAAAPVGALRWRAPTAPAAWTEPRDASRRSPACPHAPARDPISGQSYTTSEDCLALDVYTPRAERGAKSP